MDDVKSASNFRTKSQYKEGKGKISSTPIVYIPSIHTDLTSFLNGIMLTRLTMNRSNSHTTAV